MIFDMGYAVGRIVDEAKQEQSKKAVTDGRRRRHDRLWQSTQRRLLATGMRLAADDIVVLKSDFALLRGFARLLALLQHDGADLAQLKVSLLMLTDNAVNAFKQGYAVMSPSNKADLSVLAIMLRFPGASVAVAALVAKLGERAYSAALVMEFVESVPASSVSKVLQLLSSILEADAYTPSLLKVFQVLLPQLDVLLLAVDKLKAERQLTAQFFELCCEHPKQVDLLAEWLVFLNKHESLRPIAGSAARLRQLMAAGHGVLLMAQQYAQTSDMDGEQLAYIVKCADFFSAPGVYEGLQCLPLFARLTQVDCEYMLKVLVPSNDRRGAERLLHDVCKDKRALSEVCYSTKK